MALWDNLENFEDDLKLHRFFLNSVKLYSQLGVDSHLWQQVDMHFLEGTFNQLVIGLETEVLQDKLPPKRFEETVVFEQKVWPLTWWDHFKEAKREGKWYWRWLKWCKDPEFTWPEQEVRTLSVNLERWISYPEAQVVTPELGKGYHGYILTREK